MTTTATPSSLFINPFQSLADLTAVYNGTNLLNATQALNPLDPDESVLHLDYSVAQVDGLSTSVSLEFISPRTNPVDCSGATHLELDYYIDSAQSNPDRASLRVGLYDCVGNATYCWPLGPDNMEYYFADAPSVLETTTLGWNTLSLEIPGAFGVPSTDIGTPNNNALDLDWIRGYRFEISIDNAGADGSFSDGGLFIRNFVCRGESLFGTKFASPEFFTAREDSGDWGEENSNIVYHTNYTSWSAGPVLELDYAVEQTEAWGGYWTLHSSLHYPFRFDLTGSTHLKFHYNNLVAQSSPTYAQFRLLLWDSSECVSDCQNRLFDEIYFTFHDILDAAPGWHETQIALKGGTTPGAEFQLPGWIGILGNQQLDVEYIQGVTLEISIGTTGGVGSRTSGTLLLAGLEAVHVEEAPKDMSACGSATSLALQGPARKIEFQVATCCTICIEDPDCMYYQINGRDCFLYHTITTDNVLLKTYDQRNLESFAVLTPAKRGDACTVCDCQDSGLVDCSNRNLNHLPVFNVSMNVTELDLRGNPNLVAILEGELSDLSLLTRVDARETGLVFVAPSTFDAVEIFDADLANIQNLGYSSPGQNSFDNICCERVLSGVTTSSGDEVSICDTVNDDGICLDCVFEEGYNYQDESLSLAVVRKDSLFGEGSEDPWKCGELCYRTKGCLYFTWDGRDTLVDPVCYLKTNDNGRILSTDESTRLGHITPGYYSGYVAYTRGNRFNATVRFDDSTNPTGVSPSTDNTMTYALKLSSRPTRGAVWITPKVDMLVATDVTVRIFPATVVIYPEDWEESVNVTVVVDANGERGGVFASLSHEVMSCDEAFTTNRAQEEWLKKSLFFELPPPEEDLNYSRVKPFCFTLFGINITMATVFLVISLVKKRHPVVKASQSIFLSLIALGGIVSSMTMVALVADDSADVDGLARTGQYTDGNRNCMATVWLYSLGFTITMAPLFAKSWRVSKIFNQSGLAKIVISNWQVLGICALMIAVDTSIILAWTFAAPLQMWRITLTSDEFGNPTSSVGICQSTNDSTPFLVLLALFHVAVLVYGNYICYKVKNLNGTILSEGKYVQVAMFSNLQVLALGVPLLIIVADAPETSMFVRSGVIFLNDATTMLLIFIPKLIAMKNKVGISTGILSGARLSHNVVPMTGSNGLQSRGSCGKTVVIESTQTNISRLDTTNGKD